MDSDTLRPVIIGMTLFMLMSHINIKKSTDVKVIDDVIAYLMVQKGSLMSGIIVVGIIVYLSNYINEKIL